MKKLQVPYNLDKQVLELYSVWKDYIAEIYFAPHPSLFPTARQFNIVDEKLYIEEIKNICNFGIENNINTMLLLNGTNVTLTDKKFQEISVLLKDLIPYKLTGVIVANPLLAFWVNKNFPNLKIRLSILSLIDNINQIKQIENLGFINEICLPQSYNRNIDMLKLLHKEFPNMKFSTIVNSGCRADCPLFNWHHSAFNSNVESWGEGHFEELKKSLYTQTKYYNNNIFASPWILPSQLHKYDEYIHQFKLEDRTIPTSQLHSYLISYATRTDPEFLVEFLHGSCVKGKLSHTETKSITQEWKNYIINCKNRCWDCDKCNLLLKKSREDE